jgi:hypothetical protein
MTLIYSSEGRKKHVIAGKLMITSVSTATSHRGWSISNLDGSSYRAGPEAKPFRVEKGKAKNKRKTVGQEFCNIIWGFSSSLFPLFVFFCFHYVHHVQINSNSISSNIGFRGEGSFPLADLFQPTELGWARQLRHSAWESSTVTWSAVAESPVS